MEEIVEGKDVCFILKINVSKVAEDEGNTGSYYVDSNVKCKMKTIIAYTSQGCYED